MEHWPACHVCKTAYIAAVNRMRCESCSDPNHKFRGPGHELYQPCLVPSVSNCGKWIRLKRWWDDLPRPEAIKLLQGSTRFGRFYLQLESHVLHQLVAAGCSDVHTLARHPLVLQSTPDKAPSATYVVAAGLAIVAASLTCCSSIPSAEELFKWLVYASEGTCLRTRPYSGTIEESCLRNPREWPAALASSLESRILAVCPPHIACWDVASTKVLQQPEKAAVHAMSEPGKRTRRGRTSRSAQAAAACEARCDGGHLQQHGLSRGAVRQLSHSGQEVNGALEALGQGGPFRRNPPDCAQLSSPPVRCFATSDVRCGNLAEGCIGEASPACCSDTMIAALHLGHQVDSSQDDHCLVHRATAHSCSDSGTDSQCPAQKRALSGSPALTIMSAETASKAERTTQMSSLDQFRSGQSSVGDIASPRPSDVLQ